MTKNPDEFYLIFEDGDALRAEVVKSAFEAAGIDCFIQNEGVQNLFAMGGMGGLNPLMGTVKVYIRSEDQARAEALLADLQAKPEQESVPEQSCELPPESCSETPRSEGKGFLSLLRQWFGK